MSPLLSMTAGAKSYGLLSNSISTSVSYLVIAGGGGGGNNRAVLEAIELHMELAISLVVTGQLNRQ